MAIPSPSVCLWLGRHDLVSCPGGESDDKGCCCAELGLSSPSLFKVIVHVCFLCTVWAMPASQTHAHIHSQTHTYTEWESQPARKTHTNTHTHTQSEREREMKRGRERQHRVFWVLSGSTAHRKKETLVRRENYTEFLTGQTEDFALTVPKGL